TIIILIHLAVFMLLGDLFRFILQKSGTLSPQSHITDICALVLCVAYFCIGWYLMHGLWETDYNLTTDKNVETIRIAHIADSHIGTGFSGKGFADKLKKIEEASPDLLVITGDFVDDSTSKQDMIDACAALGAVDLKYGKYFCFGNHDRGYYSDSRRGYGGDDLIAELEKNGVTVLQDDYVPVGDSYYIIGRHDAGYGASQRLDTAELVDGLDSTKYTIVLDHQPTDYDGEAAAGVDLVLSGHTHGGQLWPLEYIQPLVSSNDNVRGYERRGNTDFIVTDGISDWAVKFRTGCKSEFNIINISSR
nr:metallophosphoesterase [Lachnospiraceae bacterium]